MELRLLKAFSVVVETGSFTAAAEKLHVTQPTISKAIKQLEDEIGQPLLHRHTRTLRLTDVGETVQRHAHDILRASSQLDTAVSDLSTLVHGELRIGIPPLGPRLFIPMIAAFTRRYPGVELKFLEDGSRTIEAGLQSGELDMGGLLAPIDASQYEHRTLVEDHLGLLAPAKSRWAKRGSVSLLELAEEPFIMFSSAFMLNERIVDACRQCGFEPQVVGRSGQVSFIIELVRSGVGIVLLPESELAALDLRGVARTALVDPIIPWQIELAWPKSGYLSHAARAWLSLMAA